MRPAGLRTETLRADVAILGGGVGGCAAALAAARNGCRVVMTEETGWIGGQLTQQAVPPDEHDWIEAFGATRSYRTFRQGVRGFYARHYPLSASSRADPHFNPGNCWVSALCHEPRVALSVLEALLEPYLYSGHLTILRYHRPVSAQATGDRVQAVWVEDLQTGDRCELEAPWFLDATELGDLLPMTGTAYVTGAEAQAQTGELHAPTIPQPANQQAFTWCFVMEYRPGEDHIQDAPPQYDFWKAYVPTLAPSWPGRLLSLTYSNPLTLTPRTLPFDPRPDATEPGWWAYRRVHDAAQFEATGDGSRTLVNWPQNDYLLGNLVEVPEDEQQRHLEGGRHLSLALFHWLQTEAPRPDGGTGWPGLRLRGDLTGTTHGLALRPYIRESRRIRAVFPVCEQHVGLEARMQETGLPRDQVQAAAFPDSVGIGYYRIDLHPSTGGDNYLDIPSLPFEIPLGALLPERMENLLPACKNLGVTHITNGCYRLHPVEWNIGEAAGMLAAWCGAQRQSPRQVRENAAHLQAFQQHLMAQGFELRWPSHVRGPG
jgi:hypothetical protein